MNVIKIWSILLVVSCWVCIACSNRSDSHLLNQVELWNRGNTKEGIILLPDVYAVDVLYYGNPIISADIVTPKIKALSDDFKYKIISEITIIHEETFSVCLFERAIESPGSYNSSTYCLVFGEDGKIIEELDVYTFEKSRGLLISTTAGKYLEDYLK